MPTQQSYTFASHTSQPTSQSLQKSMPAPRQDKFNFFLPSLQCFNFFATHSRHISSWTETAKIYTGQGLTMTVDRRPACNSGFAKKRVQWLIEHSTSHQLLWYVDSFVLPCLPAGREIRHLRQARNRV
jgi:hypothetical protein